MNTFDTLKKYYDGIDKPVEPEEVMRFECKQWEYEADTDGRLKTHIVNEHDVGNRGNSDNGRRNDERNNGRSYQRNNDERRNHDNRHEQNLRKKFCIYWNRGHCSHRAQSRFVYEESAECYFKDRCNKKEVCSYFHADMFRRNEYFLDQRQYTWRQR